MVSGPLKRIILMIIFEDFNRQKAYFFILHSFCHSFLRNLIYKQTATYISRCEFMGIPTLCKTYIRSRFPSTHTEKTKKQPVCGLSYYQNYVSKKIIEISRHLLKKFFCFVVKSRLDLNK